MSKVKIQISLLVVFLLTGNLLFAQKALLDTNQVLIGTPVNLRVLVPIKNTNEISFQEFEGQIIDGIEILNSSSQDTVEGGEFMLKSWEIISFEDSTFTIPPIQVKVGEEKFQTNSLTLTVKYFRPDSAFVAEIDTTQILKIRDIKKNENTPLTFSEFWNRFGTYILLVLLIILIVIGLLIYLKKRKENQPVYVAPVPKIPPHITAIEKLEELKNKQLWQKEKVKLYYTELTDILRIYIEGRFAIPAMEYTSEQLMAAFKYSKLTDVETSEKLNQILNFADLAKFAKLTPLSDENERSMSYASDFINSTIKAESQPKNEY